MFDSIPKTSGIYKITCTANNRFYIGSSNNIRDRIAYHKRLLRRGNHHSIHLQRAWNKHGETAFVFEVIELVIPTVLLEREQYWLDTLQPFGQQGFNTSRTAKGLSIVGRKQSLETRQKISASLKGHRVSDETRLLLSKSAKGYKHTPAARAKIAIASKNREISNETRIKIGNIHRGKTIPSHVIEKRIEAISKLWIVTTPDGEEMIVKNLRKFCSEHGLNRNSMWNVAIGNKSDHKGWKCRYA